MSKTSKFNVFKSSLIIIGIFFLSNPLIGLIDFLPDFIGYFLILIGLDCVKRLNGDLEYGVLNLKYLCVVSAASFVLMFFTFRMDSSWDLTLTFSYMAINVILGSIAVNHIYTGLDYLTDRHGKEDSYSIFEPKLMTIIYLWIKSILVIVPKLYALVEVEAAGELQLEKDYASILATKNYAIAVCFLLSIAIAVPWIKYVIKYVNYFKSDEKLINNLTEMYMKDFSKDGIPVNFFSINLGSGLILISHIFIYDFVLDTIHFLPEFLSVIISFIGILIIKKYINTKGLLKYGLLSLIFQLLIFFYRNKFIENVILEWVDITYSHLIISSVLAIGYIVFTFMYFTGIHKVTSYSYEKMFNKKLIENYEWGDIFFFIAIICSASTIICPDWRSYFIPVLIVSLFASIYHYTKIYTKFN